MRLSRDSAAAPLRTVMRVLVIFAWLALAGELVQAQAPPNVKVETYPNGNVRLRETTRYAADDKTLLESTCTEYDENERPTSEVQIVYKDGGEDEAEGVAGVLKTLDATIRANDARLAKARADLKVEMANDKAEARKVKAMSPETREKYINARNELREKDAAFERLNDEALKAYDALQERGRSRTLQSASGLSHPHNKEVES